MRFPHPVAVAALTLATAFTPLAAVAATPSIGEPVFLDDHVKQSRGDKPVAPRPATPAPDEVAPPERAPTAAASARPAKKPKAGPNLAALVVPSGENLLNRVTLFRDTGIAGVYQPSTGLFCIVPKTGVKAGLPALVVDHSASTGGEDNVVRLAADPADLGCKPKEIGAMAFAADGTGGYRLANTVAFGIVVP